MWIEDRKMTNRVSRYLVYNRREDVMDRKWNVPVLRDHHPHPTHQGEPDPEFNIEPKPESSMNGAYAVEAA